MPACGVAGGDDHLEVRVLRGKAQQFGAGEPRRADDADAEHRRMTIQSSAWSCKGDARHVELGETGQPPRGSNRTSTCA